MWVICVEYLNYESYQKSFFLKVLTKARVYTDFNKTFIILSESKKYSGVEVEMLSDS